MKNAPIQHFANLNHGDPGADAINLVELENNYDGESVPLIHVAVRNLRQNFVIHEDVSLNGVLGQLMVIVIRKRLIN